MRRVAAIALCAGVLVLATPRSATAHNEPLAPYRWVNPPPQVAAGNVAPIGCNTVAAATPDAVVASDVWTGDLQAVLSFANAPLPHRSRDSITVAITPVDAATLGPLPSGLTADGNALHITTTDGDTDLGTLDPPAKLILFVPHQTDLVVFAPDGSRWTTLSARSVAVTDTSTDYQRSGYYLAVANHPLVAVATSAPRGAVIAIVVLLPVALGVLLLLTRRRQFNELGSRQ
jgi:hypothetical protein